MSRHAGDPRRSSSHRANHSKHSTPSTSRNPNLAIVQAKITTFFENISSDPPSLVSPSPIVPLQQENPRSSPSSSNPESVLPATIHADVDDPSTTRRDNQQVINQWKLLLSGNKANSSNQNPRPTVLTSANLRANFPWGDQLAQKVPTNTRLYAINVNGISLDRLGGTFNDICKAMKEIQADILCVQEHNLDTTQFRVRSTLFDTANKHWQRNRLAFGTSPIPFETVYKPGGTMILTVESLVGRVLKQERDKWGRWVLQELMTKGNGRVVVISSYQPVQHKVHPGTTTVAAQQISLLVAQQDTVRNPRTAFRRDLFEKLKSYDQSTTSFIIVGDFNETLGSDPDGMIRLISEFGFIDLMRSRHSTAPPATYARGTKRLDYALGSPRVNAALKFAGYEEFNSRIPTDHRGYFLDFDTSILFGTETQTLATTARRGLTSNNPGQVTEYIREKHRIFTEHNVFQRVAKLLHPGNRHAQAERLDKDILDASLRAEKKVTRFGEPAWSVKLSQARQRVSLLTKQLSALKTGYDYGEVLIQAGRKLEDPLTLPTSTRACSQELRKAKQEVQTIVTDSFHHRDQERTKRIEQLEASLVVADRRTAQRLRRLKKAEDIKQLFKKLKHVRTQSTRQGVTRIEIPVHPNTDPKQCTEWMQIEIPTEIVRLLQERNRAHFGQAKGTPFTIPPLSQDLGFSGDTGAADDILQGTYLDKGLDANVQLLLRHLHHVREMAEAQEYPTITDDEFTGKLSVWSESTTTSPSGMHLGHYKALIARHAFSTDASDDELTDDMKSLRAELDSKQTALRAVHLTMINYALERGYSYNRWQNIANTILFKDTDNVRIHRTRVIHIYEADYNLILGIKWRMAMYQAEALQVLNEGQFGSRPRRNATDPVFIEELEYEISRATRKQIVFTNYDATACYDRIIPNVAALVSRKFGVSPTVVQANIKTLLNATYRIRTELGLSPTGYNHTHDAPIFGTGQGSANSPAIWCFLSSCLMDAYDTIAIQAQYRTPKSEGKVSLGLIAFVDDCNGQTNCFESDSSEETLLHILRNTQANAQKWSDLLHTSGGALELSKCSCQVMHWLFTARGAPVLAPKNLNHQTYLKVMDGTRSVEQNLQLLSPYQAHKTLGHYKDPAGTQSEQFRQLSAKSADITSFLWRCPLTPLEAWTFYYACYLPSVGYPLACSALSQRKLHQVQRRAMSIIVPRCGFNRNTKKAILYGPLELGGACFRDLYTQQGIGQIGLFLRNWRAFTTAGKLLRIAVSWFQIQIGTSYSFLEKVNSVLPHLESKWLSSLRDFLASIQSHLELEDKFIQPRQRVHDSYIMDLILDSKRFTNAEIRRLNYCRMYLQALTLSDLTDTKGTQLDTSKTQGHFSESSSRTVDSTVNQGRPSDQDWKLWQQANLIWSTSNGQLKQSMGAWVVPIKGQRQRHAAYWNITALWVRVDQDHYRKCNPTVDNDVIFLESSEVYNWVDVDPTCHPAAVTLLAPHRWEVTSSGAFWIQSPSVPIAGTFEQYVQQLDPWEQELLHHIHWSADPFSVSLAMTHGLRGVSDGSVWIKTLGAFGWALSDDLGERLVEGMGPAPGWRPTSYRTEAYGMLALLCFLKRLAEFTGHHEPWEGILATDSLSLLNTIQGITPAEGAALDDLPEPADAPLDTLCPEWDLLEKIRRLLWELPELDLKHVRGHQDRQVEYRNLSLLARLNVRADDMANQYQRAYGEARALVPLVKGTGVHLITPTGTVTSKYATAIRYHATYLPLMQHIQDKYAWTPAISELINWPTHSASLRKRMKHRTHFVKLVHEILPTNHSVHRHDPRRKGCPVCTCHDETWAHILQCPHTNRSTWRAQLYRQIRKTCEKWKTRPGLQEILLDGIKGWLESDSPDDFQLADAVYDDQYCRLIAHQNRIGWRQTFLGRFVWEWSDIQDAHYVTQPNIDPKRRAHRTGAKWQNAIIGCIWDQWHQLWLLRNGDVHGVDKTQAAELERLHALRELRAVYDMRSHYEPSAQELLMKDLRDHEAMSTKQIRNWLAIHRSVLLDSYKRATRAAITGMRSLRTYWAGV